VVASAQGVRTSARHLNLIVTLREPERPQGIFGLRLFRVILPAPALKERRLDVVYEGRPSAVIVVCRRETGERLSFTEMGIAV
jgi:hypothetical protein